MKPGTGQTVLVLLFVFVAVISQSQPAEAYLPERCPFPVPLNCKDYVVTDEADHSDGTTQVPGIMIVLLNGGSREMYIKNITAQPKAFNPFNEANGDYNCSWVKPGDDDEPFRLKNGQKARFSLTNSSEQEEEEGCPYNDDVKNKDWYSVQLRYSWADSPDLSYVITGQVGRSSSSRLNDHLAYGPSLEQILVWFFAIPLWLIVSIYLIVRNRSDKAGLNAERKLGIALIVALIALAAVRAILGAFTATGSYGFFYIYFYTYLVAPLIAVIVLSAGIAYAARKKAKLPVIPVVMLAVTSAIIEILAVTALLNVIA